ncbi:arabinogalactan endo-1,4-beta-galactosidase [Phocaeicola dorei]|nr:arabinogalactan endo-1,4-beta-galactosidase [Phocaeicola dorei]
MKKITHYLVSMLCYTILLLTGCTSKQQPYCIGADISFVPQSEKGGVVYKNVDGKETDICQIMAAHHFNTIRLRVFVNPEAKEGYAPEKGYCDLKHTLAMARRIKKAGMKFALDLHYSDTWADPDKQFKPSAWEGTTGAELEEKLYSYTKDVMIALKQAEVAPEIVQIGNEINHGMVWPEGKLDDNATEENWRSLMELYKAGQRAVREVLPESKLQVHLALGGQNLALP